MILWSHSSVNPNAYVMCIDSINSSAFTGIQMFWYADNYVEQRNANDLINRGHSLVSILIIVAFRLAELNRHWGM